MCTAGLHPVATIGVDATTPLTHSLSHCSASSEREATIERSKWRGGCSGSGGDDVGGGGGDRGIGGGGAGCPGNSRPLRVVWA